MDRITDVLEKAVARIWPESRQGQIVLVGSTLTVAAIILRPLTVHYILGRQVRHTYPSQSAREAAAQCGEISTLPPKILEDPDNLRIAHDKVEKAALGFHASPSFENGELFTKILRDNMLQFSKTAQSYITKIAVPERRSTFSADYIRELEFREGDMVCGGYTVVRRTPLRCELAISLPQQISPVEGILAIRVTPLSNGALFTSETIQWVDKSSGVVLPLERWLLRFMHSLVSRRLVIAAAATLERSAPKTKP